MPKRYTPCLPDCFKPVIDGSCDGCSYAALKDNYDKLQAERDELVEAVKKFMYDCSGHDVWGEDSWDALEWIELLLAKIKVRSHE